MQSLQLWTSNCHWSIFQLSVITRTVDLWTSNNLVSSIFGLQPRMCSICWLQIVISLLHYWPLIIASDLDCWPSKHNYSIFEPQIATSSPSLWALNRRWYDWFLAVKSPLASPYLWALNRRWYGWSLAVKSPLVCSILTFKSSQPVVVSLGFQIITWDQCSFYYIWFWRSILPKTRFWCGLKMSLLRCSHDLRPQN